MEAAFWFVWFWFEIFLLLFFFSLIFPLWGPDLKEIMQSSIHWCGPLCGTNHWAVKCSVYWWWQQCCALAGLRCDMGGKSNFSLSDFPRWMCHTDFFTTWGICVPAVNSRGTLDPYIFFPHALYQPDINNHKSGRCLYGARGGACVTSARVVLGGGAEGHK